MYNKGGSYMKFNWDEFSEKDFANYCKKMRSNIEYEGEWVGCVRVGDLCFDLVIALNKNDDMIFEYDLYVGNVDTGYGYSNLNKNDDSDDYPYDCVNGLNFPNTCVDMTYEYFKEYAEAEFEHFIIVEDETYKLASLIDKANEELKVW